MSAAARLRYTMVAGVTAVVIGTGFTVIGLNRHAAEASIPTAAEATTAPAVADSLPATEEATPAPSPTPTPTKTPAPRRTTTAPKKTTKPPTRAAAALTVPRTGDAILDAVLEHINAARTDAGLSPLTLDSGLSRASAKHNQLMINSCGLEHQCPGESGLGDRFTAQGVEWTRAGENIGFGSSGSSDAAIIKAANGLTDSMLAERPPNDGHRKNLLNTSFKRIGLSVVRDAKGITWMTQDFVN
ncbi:CAP domain-containing protein [Actinoplanes sp. KI2]|uniref:CAP domain-containing protein n=1 Tax=Actinoplanes sp. KI2 TaxID=2983315 RepID=UPI0021D5768A|nr:CAP domain-containing protein [Actinoplanes sp. KI2]MCU7729043.1 CAP domain-containing protein [Actinoplanes sp. KI2]